MELIQLGFTALGASFINLFTSILSLSLLIGTAIFIINRMTT